MSIIKWKCLDEEMKSDDNNVKWIIGQWYESENKPLIDKHTYGYYTYDNIIHAMNKPATEYICKVEVAGDYDENDYNSAWSRMKILSAYKWCEKDSIELALYAAEEVIDICKIMCPTDDTPYRLISMLKCWIKTPTAHNKTLLEKIYYKTIAVVNELGDEWTNNSEEQAAKEAIEAVEIAGSIPFIDKDNTCYGDYRHWQIRQARVAVFNAYRALAYFTHEDRKNTEVKKMRLKIQTWLENRINGIIYENGKIKIDRIFYRALYKSREICVDNNTYCRDGSTIADS